jgi:hypothetical protein
LVGGPDANYREPNGTAADGFSTTLANGPTDLGTSEDYARRKAANFPNEGGPAILAIELPDDLADAMAARLGELIPGKALNVGSEIRFEPSGGLEQLLTAWPNLTRTVTLI